MSIESMCVGSAVVKQAMAHSIGPMGDDVVVYTDGDTLTCGCQVMSGNEEFRFDGHGEHRVYTLFFSSNPGLSVDNRLRLVMKDNNPVSPAIILNVNDAYTEDRPSGGLRLWVVECDEVTTQLQTDST